MELKEYFPCLIDPEWLAHRERAWQLLLTGSFKKNYRKKDLEKIKKFFFEGVKVESYPLDTEFLTDLYLFPLQNEQGYDFFYSNTRVSQKDLDYYNRKIFSDGSEYGMLPEDQLAYWDYHVGKTFQPTVQRKTPDGIVELEIDPEDYLANLLIRLRKYLDKNSYSSQPKWVDRLDYLFSILKYCQDQKISFAEDVDDFFRRVMERTLKKQFGSRITKVTEHHIAFCEDMVLRVDKCDYLPDSFKAIWQEIKSEI